MSYQDEQNKKIEALTESQKKIHALLKKSEDLIEQFNAVYNSALDLIEKDEQLEELQNMFNDAMSSELEISVSRLTTALEDIND